MNAVEMVVAKAGNYTAPYGQSIKGNVGWQNLILGAGTLVQVGFLLGKGGGLYAFDHAGVQWLAGSVIEAGAPGFREVSADIVPSKAAWWLNGAWDALVFVGQAAGPVTTILWNGRIIGLHAAQFMANMQILGDRWFDQMLTVEASEKLVLDRFFVLNHPWQFGPEWDAHCWIKNIGGAPVSGQLRWEGEVHYYKGRLVYELDRRRDFTVQPGETFIDIWSWYTGEPLDPAWVRCHIDDQPIMPRFDWLPGYYSHPSDTLVEVKATHVGADWAILRYCQRSDCTHWRVRATHPPPIEGPADHVISYPDLRNPGWASTFEHLVTGLRSKKRYEGYIYGWSIGGAHRAAYTIFTTR